MTPDTWWWPPDFIFAKHPDTGPQMDTNYTSPGFPGCCKTAVKCNVYDHDQTPQGPATCTYCGCDCGKSTICVPEK